MQRDTRRVPEAARVTERPTLGPPRRFVIVVSTAERGGQGAHGPEKGVKAVRAGTRPRNYFRPPPESAGAAPANAFWLSIGEPPDPKTGEEDP